jgi:hypothetical protein
MNKESVFVADVFAHQHSGGGELNNEELIKILSKRGYNVLLMNSQALTPEVVREKKDSWFVIANFIFLSEESKELLRELNVSYLVYEHDHKYLLTRDPSVFEDYTAPEDQVINRDFYKAAKAVFCQSKLHKEVVDKNLKIDNTISVGGNLWSSETLDYLSELGKKEKERKCAIWCSPNPIKGTQEAKIYCSTLNLEYKLIFEAPHHVFLDKLTNYKSFLFLPTTLETLCRVVVECRMAGMTVLLNKRIGATSEDWFSLKGEELIAIMRKKRTEIPDMVLEAFSS